MTLADIRDYVDALGIADYVYQSKLPRKPEKAVGVYNSRRANEYKTAIGGHELESYGTRYVTFLVHWNKSPRETEAAAVALFEALRDTREAVINDATIKFILPLNDIQDVGTDDDGICEMVIDAAVVYGK